MSRILEESVPNEKEVNALIRNLFYICCFKQALHKGAVIIYGGGGGGGGVAPKRKVLGKQNFEWVKVG